MHLVLLGAAGRTMRMVRELRNLREPNLNSASAPWGSCVCVGCEKVRVGPKSPAPCCKLLSQPPALHTAPQASEILQVVGPLQRERPWRTIFTLPTTSTCLFHLGPNWPRPKQRIHGGRDWPLTALCGPKSGNASKKDS